MKNFTKPLALIKNATSNSYSLPLGSKPNCHPMLLTHIVGFFEWTY